MVVLVLVSDYTNDCNLFIFLCILDEFGIPAQGVVSRQSVVSFEL